MRAARRENKIGRAGGSSTQDLDFGVMAIHKKTWGCVRAMILADWRIGGFCGCHGEIFYFRVDPVTSAAN